MKTVFSKAKDLVHVYAQKTQSEGRSNNIFFNRTNLIYSYGQHYLLGEFTTINNEETIIINNSGYSHTTSNHISILWSATSQHKRIHLTDIDPSKVLSKLKDLQNSLNAAKKPEIYLNQANELLKSFNEFHKLSKKDKDFLIKTQMNYNFDLFNKKEIQEIKKLSKVFDFNNYKGAIEKAKEIKAKHEKELKELGKSIYDRYMKLWSNHADLTQYFKDKPKKYYSLFNEYRQKYGEDHLRINKNLIETSQGVKVEISEAKELYKAILAGIDIKGFKIGYYTVISINGVLTIGCHKINIQSVHSVGKQII